MVDHAILSPSGSSRWLNCYGSVWFENQFPDETQSSFAAEGDQAHDLAADFLNNKAVVESDYPTDMYNYCLDYSRHMAVVENSFMQYVKETTVYRSVEQRFDYNENLWGTADFSLTVKRGDQWESVIVDLKYGKGVEVDVQDNTQLLSYALCLRKTLDLDIKKFYLFIYQPRIGRKVPFLRWEITDKELDLFEKRFLRAEKDIFNILEGKEDNPQFKAGSYCRFCKAQSSCTTYQEHMLDDLHIEALDQTPSIDVRQITIEEKVKIFKVKKDIERFLSAVAKDLQEQLKLGLEVPGVKLVTGRRQRKWDFETELDKQAIAKGLKVLGVAHPFEKKLIGVTKAEAQTGKGKIDKFCTLTDAKVQIALEDDKRTAIVTENELTKLLEEK